MKRGIDELLGAGESRAVEFKSTGRENLHTRRKDGEIEWALIKTIAGFSNADGGTVLVGVDDKGEPIGIERDYRYLKRSGTDGWGLWLTGLVRERLGAYVAAKLEISYGDVGGATVARIDVDASSQAVYAKDGRKRRDVFYVRQGPSTGELRGSDLQAYVADHFGGGRESLRDRVDLWKRVVLVGGSCGLVVLSLLLVFRSSGVDFQDPPVVRSSAERAGPVDGESEAGRTARHDDVASYRSRFSPARSGNGWTRRVTLDEWQVTLWVGYRGNEPAAVVFSPRRRRRAGDWIESESGPLMEGTHLNEEAAFSWLMELEDGGALHRESRRSINALRAFPDRSGASVSVLDEEREGAISGGAAPAAAGTFPSDDSAGAVDPKVDRYRQRFDAAGSGNGWTRSVALVDGWEVRLWVGTRQGKPSAAVFGPGKREGGRWIESRNGPLMEAGHTDFDAAFGWLLQLETEGAMREAALRAVEDFAGAVP